MNKSSVPRWDDKYGQGPRILQVATTARKTLDAEVVRCAGTLDSHASRWRH
jgi:hypothetical protein